MKKVESVIKWDRPQMVGEFYEPYRVTWSDAFAALEMLVGLNRGGFANRREHFTKMPVFVKGMDHIGYDPAWETYGWGW